MDELLQILQQAALGSVVGYGTNWLAIRLLFQPYKRHKVGPVGFGPGVFVRHQDNLARQVAKIASDSILTVESLQEKLESQNLQDFFRGQLQDFLRTKAAEDFGPVKDQIPSDLNRDYRELVLYARGKLKDTVRDYLLSDEFGDIMRGVVYDQLDYFGRFPLSQILDEDSRGRVHEVAHTFLVEQAVEPGYP
ncbi:MAG: DUF445 family protein [Planctomycetota bacterium]|nr:DUF445 family protein [Planctomycetota bacterium]